MYFSLHMERTLQVKQEIDVKIFIRDARNKNLNCDLTLLIGYMKHYILKSLQHITVHTCSKLLHNYI